MFEVLMKWKDGEVRLLEELAGFCPGMLKYYLTDWLTVNWYFYVSDSVYSQRPYFHAFSHGQFYRIAVVNWSRELVFLRPLEDITGAGWNWRNIAQL